MIYGRNSYLLAIQILFFSSSPIYGLATGCPALAIALRFTDVNHVDCAAIKSDGNVDILSIFIEDQKRFLHVMRFRHSDEYLQKVALDQYRNAKFKGPSRGDAVRLAFPEKSTAIIYWDDSSKSARVFWESD